MPKKKFKGMKVKLRGKTKSGTRFHVGGTCSGVVGVSRRQKSKRGRKRK